MCPSSQHLHPYYSPSPFSILVHPCTSEDHCRRCIHAFFANGQRSSLLILQSGILAGGTPVTVTDHRAPQSPPKIAELILGIAINNIRTYLLIPPSQTPFRRSQEEAVCPARARVVPETIPLKTWLIFSFLFSIFFFLALRFWLKSLSPR